MLFSSLIGICDLTKHKTRQKQQTLIIFETFSGLYAEMLINKAVDFACSVTLDVTGHSATRKFD